MNGGPELDPKLASLLAEGSRASDFPEERREEFFARIAAALPNGTDTTSAPEAVPTSRPNAFAARVTKAGALLLVGGALGYAAARAFPSPTPVTPSASAVVIPSKFEPPPTPSASVESGPAPHASSAATAPPEPRLLTTAAPRARRTASPASSPPPASSELGTTTHTALAEERSLVERGRAALARRDPLSALQALTAHEHAFPRGKLSEERDALFVQALALSGRAADARRRAHDFEQRYPTSVFIPRIEATLRDLSP